MFIRVFLCFALLSLALCARARAQTVLKFYLGLPQAPPVFYQHPNSGEFGGIVMDVLQAVPEGQSVQFDFVIHNRKRGEQAMYNGQLDGTVMTKSWAMQPDALIYSTPLFPYRDLLFARDEDTGMGADIWQRERRVCTRRGFVYPKLNTLFSNDLAVRIDSNSEHTMMVMLMKGRCELAVINELVALWLTYQNGWQGEMKTLGEPINTVPLTLAFTPKWRKYVDALNATILRLKQSGEFNRILDKHLAALQTDHSLLVRER